MLTVLQHLRAIYEYVLHSDSILMRLGKSRAIPHRRRIEDNNISKHAFLEITAVTKS